jgi:acetyltransferase-like isoleucine patch superfamily enzyme
MINLYETEIKKVIIEHRVYVGANCVILMGVIINQNSLIGAYSLVNKSIPENCIAYGNPAKVVKSISVI